MPTQRHLAEKAAQRIHSFPLSSQACNSEDKYFWLLKASEQQQPLKVQQKLSKKKIIYPSVHLSVWKKERTGKQSMATKKEISKPQKPVIVFICMTVSKQGY